MRKPIHARVSKRTSRAFFQLFTTLIVRLRRPWGARMANVDAVAARITAFAIQGSIMGTAANGARDKLPPRVEAEPGAAGVRPRPRGTTPCRLRRPSPSTERDKRGGAPARQVQRRLRRQFFSSQC